MRQEARHHLPILKRNGDMMTGGDCTYCKVLANQLLNVRMIRCFHVGTEYHDVSTCYYVHITRTCWKAS